MRDDKESKQAGKREKEFWRVVWMNAGQERAPSERASQQEWKKNTPAGRKRRMWIY
jgi:hypothetical protein